MIGALVAGQVGSGGASLNSYESIATITASGSQSSLTFSSIPSTFKHLQIRGIVRDGIGYILQLRLNSDSGSNYSMHRLYANGASTFANGGASQTYIYLAEDLSTASNTLNAAIIDILDYGSTTKNKTVRCLQGLDTNGAGHVGIYSGAWLSTSAVNSVTITNTGPQNFTNTTTFALYGIKEA